MCNYNKLPNPNSSSSASSSLFLYLEITLRKGLYSISGQFNLSGILIILPETPQQINQLNNLTSKGFKTLNPTYFE